MKKAFLFSLCAGLWILLFLGACQTETTSQKKNSRPNPVAAPPSFSSEGELYFLRGQDTLQKIQIEIADNENEKSQGLMNRPQLPAQGGMLFVFEEEAERQFWMRNTLISLDILYLNAAKEIVHIAAYTQPESDAPIPSQKPAQYVVEVNAGFCESHQIKPGDKIAFTRLSN
ncbi:MAG: DUF192 domain-containing protein [Microscillaceae bacterium]|nr:DUF192 domain-containing protein [Microscillaceae bacterium]